MRRWLIAPVLALVALVGLVAVHATPARADIRDFTLVNNSSSVIISYVYVSPSESSDWGDDVLGDGVVLAPGESIDIVFNRFVPGKCSYDIKVVGSEGEEGYLYGVDLCTISTVTFS